MPPQRQSGSTSHLDSGNYSAPMDSGMPSQNSQGSPQSFSLAVDAHLQNSTKVPPGSAGDVDAIADALNNLSSEFDAMERAGKILADPPEKLDDLVVADMYTPLSQLPASQRKLAKHVPDQPAEEGYGVRQETFVNPSVILHENEARVRETLNVNGAQKRIPPSAKIDESLLEKTQPQLNGSQVNDLQSDSTNRFQNTPEVSSQSKVAPIKAEVRASTPTEKLNLVKPKAQISEQIQPKIINKPSPENILSSSNSESQKFFDNLADDSSDFLSQLMPKSDAYSVSRDKKEVTEKPKKAISREDLKAIYQSQRDTRKTSQTVEKKKIVKPVLKQSEEQGFLSSTDSFLSGLDKSDTSSGADSSSAGGYLAGLASDIKKDNPLEQEPANNIPIGSELFDRYNSSNLLSSEPEPQPQVQPQPQLQPQPYVQPKTKLIPEPVIINSDDNNLGNSPIWHSESISPAARAYRDRHFQDNILPDPTGQVQLPPVAQNSPQYQPQPIPQQTPPNIFDSLMETNEAHHNTLEKTTSKPNKPKKAKRAQRPQSGGQTQIGIHDISRRLKIHKYFGKFQLASFLSSTIAIGIMGSQFKYDRLQDSYKPEMNEIFLAGACILFISLIVWLIRRVKPKEYLIDEWLAEDMVVFEKHALEMLELPKYQLLLDPIVMSGFPDLDNLGMAYRKGFYGNDHILRYTPRSLTAMCFRQDKIMFYQGALDLTTGKLVYETIREFFYTDISKIGVTKVRVRRAFFSLSRLRNLFLPWRWYFVERFIRMLNRQPIDEAADNTKEAFQIILKDGTHLELVMSDSRILNHRAFEDIPMSTDEKVIRAIQEFVVVRKNAQLRGI